MTDFLFEPPTPLILPTSAGDYYPVHRIFCVGKNYAAHVAELGFDPATSEPIFFSKPTVGAVSAPTLQSAESVVVSYPAATDLLHYEGELFMALTDGGFDVAEDDALDLVGGIGLGCDLTRRDLQMAAKEAGNPWDLGKGFDGSAVLGGIALGTFPADITGYTLSLNDQVKQSARLEDMIWSPAAVISRLSRYGALRPGDVIFTGTPEGVGALSPGDHVVIEAEGVPSVSFRMA
ncbi:putative isomerase-decarboxylase-like protein [Parvularcula bermudensis HTCC2503]|uniref:Putative isomerase-decarboxylase-like protein n=1 Tax=Parvularcula bermudensis (strain ATCC BAA-594 / HTCC2503 / KCTC 12087) TaxID=314260 RepID=E0TE76_PARBH|nr:fumarylacetoacetate hydrolase family protein [Parvularcula bermudensis]ADM09451.1 putative isomerase-decarboxylase-like protein [Parvularcula bermudensis HTCC2503]